MYKLINSNNYQQRKRNLALKNIYEIVNNKMDIKKKKKKLSWDYLTNQHTVA